MPRLIKFKDQSTITYTYAADGTKLRVEHKIGNSTTRTTYCSNVIYEGSIAKCLLTEEGYVSLNDNKYHYYLKDHQGNNRIVIDQNGNVEETNHYYPFGGVFANTGNAQPYKYNGKELDAKKGLNWYDYGARHYDAVLGRYHTNDRFAEKYYLMSTYQYGANNPTKNIDVNGDSLAVLHLTNGEHLGLLIQNDSKQWVYYSFNGSKIYNLTGGSKGGGPEDNKGERAWSSPQAFLDDSYNRSTSNAELENGEVNGYGYQEGYLIPTTKEQDKMTRETFLETIDQGYSLIDNQCSMAVQKALNAAGIKTQANYNYAPVGASALYSSHAQYNPYLPSVAYRTIVANNPNGIYIKKR